MSKILLHTSITEETLTELEELADAFKMPRSILVEQFVLLGLYLSKEYGMVITSKKGAELAIVQHGSKISEILTIDTDKHWVAIEAGERQRHLRKGRERLATRT